MIWMNDYFLLKTERRQPGIQSDYCVFKEEPDKCNDRNDEEIGQIELSRQLMETDFI